MRGILINPMDRTVMDIETDGELASLYQLLQCSIIEAFELPANHILWLDEEGLYAQPPKPFFIIEGYEYQPFCGLGLILGRMHEDMDSAHLPLDFIHERVRWPDIEFMGMDISHEEREHMGRSIHAIVGKALFKDRG